MGKVNLWSLNFAKQHALVELRSLKYHEYDECHKKVIVLDSDVAMIGR